MLLKKCKNKKRKLYHIDWGCDFFNDFSYYDFKSVIINGFKGCLYYLDNPNIEKLKEVEKKYHNTLVLNGHREYAPEQTFTCLFIASKYVGGVENE